MDLNKMREFNWVDQLKPILKKYKSRLLLGDQDIINIIFSKQTGKIKYILLSFAFFFPLTNKSSNLTFEALARLKLIYSKR